MSERDDINRLPGTPLGRGPGILEEKPGSRPNDMPGRRLVEACVFIFLVGFAVFLPKAAPHITAGDAGELALAAETLGVAHSPGYPVFVCVNKILGALIYFGNPAYRQNVACCLVMCFAFVLTGLITRELSKQDMGIFLPLVLIGSALAAHLSMVTEVFPLAFLWACVLTLSALRAEGPPGLFLIAFLGGIGLAVHQTLVLIYPAMAALYFFKEENRRSFNWITASAALGFFLAGISVNLFILIRAGAGPVLSWEDPTTMDRFWGVLTRARYGFFQLAQGGKSPALHWKRFVSSGEHVLSLIVFNIGWSGLMLALLSVLMGKKSAAFWLFLILSGPFFIWYSNTSTSADVLARFGLLPLIGALFLAALGFNWVAQRGRWAAITALAVFLIEAGTAHAQSGDKGLRWELSVRESALNILSSLPSKALLFADRADETEFSLAYILAVDKKKPGLKFIDCNAGVTPSIYGDGYYRIWGKPRLEIREKEERARMATSLVPVYYATVEPEMIEIPRHPYGLIFSVGKRRNFPWHEIFSWRFLPVENRGKSLFFTNMNLLGNALYYAGFPEGAEKAFGFSETFGGNNRFVQMGYLAQRAGHNAEALEYYKEAAESGFVSETLFSNYGAVLLAAGRPQEAISIYERGLDFFPASQSMLYNLGVVYWHLGDWVKVKQTFDEVLMVNPGHAEVLRLLPSVENRLNAKDGRRD